MAEAIHILERDYVRAVQSGDAEAAEERRQQLVDAGAEVPAVPGVSEAD